MITDKIIVSLAGLFGIVFTYWFFLMRKEEVLQANGEVDIKVEGGYKPEVISIPLGKTTKINFLRTDPSDCLSEVILSDFKIRKELPINKKVSFEITPTKLGEFIFSCGMNMFHGKVIVK